MSTQRNDKVAKAMLKFKKMDKKQKTGVTLLCILALFIVFSCFAYLTGSVIRTMRSLGHNAEGLRSAFYYGFTGSGLVVTSVLFLLMLVLVAVAIWRRTDMVNKAAHYDERGLGYGQKPVAGSSRWETDEEAAKDFHVTPVEEAKNVIYGVLPSDSAKVVSNRPPEEGGVNSDQNTLVIGSPGTGKSYAYVRTELMQTVLRGHSFVVTDPSGELYSSMSQFCRNKGLDVQVLNLANTERSDFWNCLDETINKKTGRLDGSRLNEFTDIYMRNSSEGKEDPFWAGSASNLLRAIIGYCSWQHESEIISGLENLYQTVGAMDEPDIFLKNTRRFTDTAFVPITWCKKVCLEAAERNGYDVEETKKIVQKIEDSAPPYTMAQLFQTMLGFSAIIADPKKFDGLPNSHPGKIAYGIFLTNSSPTVQGSALQGLQMRFQTFADRAIQEVLSHDGIDLSNINRKQSAYFVITSDKSTALKPIASLFFSFLFKDAQDNWDEANPHAEADGYKSTYDPAMPKDYPYRCLPVTIMLDEFFSLGVIGGNPDVFATTMANSRKRLLRVSIILQNFPQLGALYGDNHGRSIQNCCATVLFLGCNDQETAEFISSFISGEATVMNESHTETLGLTQRAPGYGNGITVSSVKRRLLTVDEARRWKDYVLVTKRGTQPLKLKPFAYINHPCYKNGELVKVAIDDTVPSLWDRVEKFRLENKSIEKTADADGVVHEREVVDGMIERLYSPKVEEAKKRYEEEQKTKQRVEVQEDDLPDITAPSDTDEVSKGREKDSAQKGMESTTTKKSKDNGSESTYNGGNGAADRTAPRARNNRKKNKSSDNGRMSSKESTRSSSLDA